MSITEVKALDRVATTAGYIVVDYRTYSYLHDEVIRYMLIVDLDGAGDEVAFMSSANYGIGRYDRIFD